MSNPSISELFEIARTAGVLRKMGEQRSRQVIVDYVPARSAVVIPREQIDDEKLEVFAPQPIVLNFVLEDAMFGGVVYVALVCNGRVVVSPFPWENYDVLTKMGYNR